MSPAGRPPLAGERKQERLMIRLTEDEKATIDAAVAILGKATATWARDSLLTLAREVIATESAAAPKPARKRKAT